MVNVINTTLSGLLASSNKVATASSNIANISTTGKVNDKSGETGYSPVDAVNITSQGGGVASRVVARDPASVQSYAPNDPNANDKGIVSAPNVNLEQEMVTLIQAEAAYKANLSVLKTAESMQDSLLEAVDKDA
jgi:flagellar basal-body rod protein FlgC